MRAFTLRALLLTGCVLVLCQCKQEVQGEYEVDACAGDGGSEKCYWRFKGEYDGTKISKLVIFFSGGEMGCDDSREDSTGVYARVMDRYVADGYLAVCAGIFKTSQESDRFPFHAESSRIQKLVSHILSTSSNYWNGKYLLFSGISHGASAPVVALARQLWNPAIGSADETGACFYDGTYDVAELNSFLVANISVCSSFRPRLCERYFDSTQCLFNASQPDVTTDTLVSAGNPTFSVRRLPIKRWKMIECGSALPACAKDFNADMLPKGSIESFCSAVKKQGGAYTCDFDSLPKSSHSICAADETSTRGSEPAIDRCRTWFNSFTK